MVTTVTTVTLMNLATTTLAFVAIFTLLVLLIGKEIMTARNGARARRISSCLNIGIVPLLIVFVITAGIQITKSFG